MQDFYNEKFWVQRAMMEHGGGFIRHIGEALTHAHITNAQIVKKTWPHFWDEYLTMAKNLYHDEMVKLGDLSEDEAIKPYKPTIEGDQEFIIHFADHEDQLVKIEWGPTGLILSKKPVDTQEGP